MINFGKSGGSGSGSDGGGSGSGWKVGASTSLITIVAILKEKTHNVLVQIGKAAKRITLYHASSQGCMARVINIMHGCYTSKKAKKKRKKATQFAIFTEQKKRYLHTNSHSHMHTIHSHHYSTVTFSYTFSSVTQSVPLLSSCLRSHTYRHT